MPGKLPVGFSVSDWHPRSRPPREIIEGAFCRLEPLRVGQHGEDLIQCFVGTEDIDQWTYMVTGPFDDRDGYLKWLRAMEEDSGTVFHAVVVDGRSVGLIALMRIDEKMGVIEIGNVHFASSLRRTPAGTEAIFLLLRRVFDELGYRRCEWKCDSLNARSRSAAERFGFQYDGTFRQARIYKGRNRDTAWYSMLDGDWPVHRRAFLTWLKSDNFDEAGHQRQRLSEIRNGPASK